MSHWVRRKLPKRSPVLRFLLAFYVGQALLGSAIGIYVGASFTPKEIAEIMEAWRG